ncbi:hypothetical protein O3M35_007286 [Rhynocoris fuscipes]|uniref:Glycerate kinase n=1 Tax=Rhynocoris fuscipes TaxID=488301 RepID=A0AAW1D925_9HEMI
MYKSCVDSVNPKTLIKKELTNKGNILFIRGNEYKLENNCYVVGFGKAVLDMGIASEDILGNHIRGGALSVPEGLLAQKPSIPKTLKVFEGAKNNIPDDNAFLASKSIVNMLETLNEKDLLFVFISGGGSALLPYPLPPVTLEEKLFVTQSLMKAGADIVEMNAVRKRLSFVKGGKLAKIAYPARTITLILSDVVNDPQDVIASGPLVPDKTPQTLAIDVLKKYDLIKDLANLIFLPSSKNKVCLLFGGETTLKVLGKGLGGRNQEMALRFSIALDQLAKQLHVIDLFNVVMLCAGTDGSDGPTDAAGAIAYNGQCNTADLQKLSPSEFLADNNSYLYYSLLDNGEDLLKSGLTGTNVMDINILTVQSKI